MPSILLFVGKLVLTKKLFMANVLMHFIMAWKKKFTTIDSIEGTDINSIYRTTIYLVK